MFAKMVLPILGGSPAVWSVTMCFFQAALLGGHAGKLKTAYKSSAVMVAFARTRSRLEPLRTMEGWEPLEDRGWRIWTDDYSNVLRAILASNSLEKSTAKKSLNQ